MYHKQQSLNSVSPELSVLADGHHDQQVAQDAHQHDQRQEADQSHPLWHAVAMETTKRHNNTSVQVCRVKLQVLSFADKSDGEKDTYSLAARDKMFM